MAMRLTLALQWVITDLDIFTMVSSSAWDRGEAGVIATDGVTIVSAMKAAATTTADRAAYPITATVVHVAVVVDSI
jgi:hypothetical protein